MIFGRNFSLGNEDRPILIFLYSLALFWFFGADVAKVKSSFQPVAMVMVALFVASLAVKPFLYAALIIELCVLLSVFMLVSDDKDINQGLMRFLVFQTLALPFILIAGWSAAGFEANPANELLLSQTIIMLGLGFVFALATFPFYTWVPQLTQSTNPYVVGFLLSFLPIVGLLLLLGFIDTYAWLRDFELTYTALRLIGSMMTITGGIWVIFQKNLARIFGYAVIIENGFTLIAIGFSRHLGLENFSLILLPRIISLALLSLGLAVIGKNRSCDLDEIKGLITEYPFVSAAIGVAIFSLGAFPILAGFPVKMILFEGIAGISLNTALWIFVGNLGLLFSGFRVIAVIMNKKEIIWKINENWQQVLFLSIGILANVAIGLFPHLLLSGMINILNSFENLI